MNAAVGTSLALFEKNSYLDGPERATEYKIQNIETCHLQGFSNLSTKKDFQTIYLFSDKKLHIHEHISSVT